MRLVKYCPKEYNVRTGANIRIGTLYSYRKIENPELRDEEEGKYTFNIEFSGEVAIERRLAGLLFQGAVGFGESNSIPRFPGAFSARIRHLEIVSQSEGEVVLKDALVEIERNVPDCLIYCMSITNDECCPFEQYDDSWSIPLDYADDFGAQIGRLIYQHSKINEFSEAISKDNSLGSLSRMSVQVSHRPVIYQDRNIKIVKSNQYTFEDICNLFMSIPFIKPDKFKKEREYRFLFHVGDNRRIYHPQCDNLFVPINVLDSFLV